MRHTAEREVVSRRRGALIRGVVAAASMLAGLGVASAGSPNTVAYVPGLGEIMATTQMRHLKLWFAGEARNRPLAASEVDELEEGFADAVRFHPATRTCRDRWAS